MYSNNCESGKAAPKKKGKASKHERAKKRVAQIKQTSLYKRISRFFTLSSMASLFIGLLILIGISTLVLTVVTKNQFVETVTSVSSAVAVYESDLTEADEILTDIIDKCIYRVINTRRNISVRVSFEETEKSNNPYFDQTLKGAEKKSYFERLSDDSVKTAYFYCDSTKYLYTSFLQSNSMGEFRIEAMSNLELNRKYTISLIIIVISVFIALNIASILTNRFLSRKALTPLEQIAEQVKVITEKNLAMRLPPAQNKGMKSDVDNLINELNEMLKRLDMAFIQQQYFISNISHELRIPLTIMKGYIDIVMSWGKGDEKLTDESLSAISEEIDNMRAIVERLLLLQSIETKTYEMNIVHADLCEIAQKTAKDTKMLSEKHTVICECDSSSSPEPIYVNIDQTLLDTAIRVITDNAVKYTPQGGTITFNALKEGKIAALIIQDDGIGIPKDECERVKERFYRTDASRDRRIGGNGLGLSLANSSIKAMGGELEIISDIGKGTKVIIELKAAE